MSRYLIISVLMMVFCLHILAAQTVSADQMRKLKTIEELVRDAHEGASFISIEEMTKRIQANDKLVLLDVRTQREYEAAHIKGAAWIERGVAEFVMVRTLPDPDVEIVVYCKKGNRTGLVVKALKQAGYRNVAGLEGGFDEWVNQGRTVHNFLGEFKMVNPAAINAATFAVDLYENKK